MKEVKLIKQEIQYVWHEVNFSDFYFDHSYGILDLDKNIDCVTNHEVDFASAISYKNIFGVQFHPEKSLDDGKILLKNFVTKV